MDSAKVGEKHRYPEPDGYLQNKGRRRFTFSAEEGVEKQERRKNAAHFHNEHNRILDLIDRIQLF